MSVSRVSFALGSIAPVPAFDFGPEDALRGLMAMACIMSDALTCLSLLVCFTAVLHTVQDKLNNPSPEDPFEPEIAAVRMSPVAFRFLLLICLLRISCFYFRMLWRSSSLCNVPETILLRIHASQLLRENKHKFLATAKDWTKK